TDAYRLQDFAAADRAQHAAAALLARLGDTPARSARFHCAVARSQWWKGDWEPALASATACVTERERQTPRDDGELARAIHMEAIVLEELGRTADDYAAEERAMTLGTRAFGARHPILARIETAAGGMLRELDRIDE